MGNSSTLLLPPYSCSDTNLSRNSVTQEYWDSSSINEDFKESTLILAVIVTILMLVGLPGNAIIIVSIIHQKLFKETTHLLLLNLAISDFLLCLLVMPLTIASGFSGGYVFGDSDYVRCQVCQTGLITNGLTQVSIFILCSLSVDRFIFIKFPIRYNRYVTVPRVIAIVILTWIVSTFIILLPLSEFGGVEYSYTTAACVTDLIGSPLNMYYSFFVFSLNFIPVGVIIIVNIWIACIVSKQIRKVYRMRSGLASNQELQTQNRSIYEKIRKQKNMKQLTLIRVFGAILSANFIAWFPVALLNVVVLRAVDHNSVPIGVYIFAYICFLAHSVFHPIIEACTLPEIKNIFKSILRVIFCSKKEKSTNHSEDRSFSWIRNCLDICSVAVLPDDA